MSSIPVINRSERRDAPQTFTDALQRLAAPFEEAANDRDFYTNPLWMIAFAFACLFVILACLIASG